MRPSIVAIAVAAIVTVSSVIALLRNIDASEQWL